MPKAKKPTPAQSTLKKHELSAVMMTGENALTAEKAIELLGMEVVDKNGTMTLVDGREVIFTNNTTNRPFYSGNEETLRQEMLNDRWRFNGEPIIVGEFGNMLDGQHTLIALIQANIDRLEDPWNKIHSKAITIDKLVVYGVSEDNSVVNTINTAKPRTLMDVFFRGPYFKTMKAKDRRDICRIADYAVRFLWSRTASHTNPWSPKRTHAESVDFFEKHDSLEKVVKHIWSEDPDGKLSKLVPLGTAVGLCYLMAAHNSDPEKYSTKRRESALTEFNLDNACDFWALVSSGKDLQELRHALAALHNEDGNRTPSRDEVTGTIIKAWLNYQAGKKITQESLTLKYTPADDDGVKYLDEWPTIPGIDYYHKESEEEEEEEPEEAPKKEKKEEKPKTSTSVVDEMLAAMKALKDQHPGAVVGCKSNSGVFTFWEEDAKIVGKAMNQKVGKHTSGLLQVKVPWTSQEVVIEAVVKAGHDIVLREGETYENVITYVTAKSKKEEKTEPKKDKKLRGGTEV